VAVRFRTDKRGNARAKLNAPVGVRFLKKPKRLIVPKTIWKQIDALLKRYDGHLEIRKGCLRDRWEGELRLGLTNPLGRPARSRARSIIAKQIGP
jgi:hypothetical protein